MRRPDTYEPMSLSATDVELIATVMDMLESIGLDMAPSGKPRIGVRKQRLLFSCLNEFVMVFNKAGGSQRHLDLMKSNPEILTEYGFDNRSVMEWY